MKDCPECWYEIQDECTCECCGAELKEIQFNDADWEEFLGSVV